MKKQKTYDLSPLTVQLDLLELVSHQLKTPLSTLKISTELIKKHLPADKQELAERMALEIEALNQLIHGLLELRKTPQSQAGLIRKWQSWTGLWQDIEKSLHHLLVSTSTRLQIPSPSKENIEIYADDLYIKQALLNLLINAIEHSPPKGVVLLHWEFKSPHSFYVSISDQGLGIPSKDMPHIFKPFFSSREKAQPFSQSSGLGLTIAEKILLAHSSSIHAQNRSQKRGACFSFTLPQARLSPAFLALKSS